MLARDVIPSPANYCWRASSRAGRISIPVLAATGREAMGWICVQVRDCVFDRRDLLGFCIRMGGKYYFSLPVWKKANVLDSTDKNWGPSCPQFCPGMNWHQTPQLKTFYIDRSRADLKEQGRAASR